MRLPVRQTLLTDALAGATLAAVAIPVVMGYTRIAGMPVVTGLYTLLLPMMLFALFGSSRHLVVAADSATAAILASGLAGLAIPDSPEWIGLAGLLALMAAGLLLIARLVRLGFLANFLSRTTLTGFLTGVGLQVALGQFPGLLGLPATGNGPVGHLVDAIGNIGQARLPVLLVSACVMLVIVGAGRLSPRIPGGLIAVAGSIAASWAFDLRAHGVPVLGAVPSGLPWFGWPHAAPDLALVERLLPTAMAMTVMILTQSEATARIHATRDSEPLDTNRDLTGLALANLGAALSGSFIVNGSPTMTQMAAGAGGRSQFVQLVAGLVTLLVLLMLTGALAYLPRAVLSAVVFLIGIELIDLEEMRRILAVRPVEFAVAVIAAVVVLLAGVEQGILTAMVLSLLAHVRRGYRPKNSLLVEQDGERRPEPVASGRELRPGLLVYRFNHSMYYANAGQLSGEVDGLSLVTPAPRWFCFDMAAVDGVDYSAGQTLRGLLVRLRQRGIRPVFAELADDVRTQLEGYGIIALLEPDAVQASLGAVLKAYETATRPSGASSSRSDP